MSLRKMLKLWAEGRLPGPMRRDAAQNSYKYLLSHPHMQLRVHHAGSSPALWVTNSDYSYLLGENSAGTQTITAIYTPTNGCTEPVTVKTDSSQNVWTACDLNAGLTAGAEQEYSSAGSLTATYSASPQGCPASVECYADAFDGGNDGNGHVYIEQSEAFSVNCASDKCTYGFLNPGFNWWNASDPSASPTFISVPYGDPVDVIYYMATDASGNIWFDYYGCTASLCGGGLADVADPTTTPAVNYILPVGTFEFPGGVSVVGQDLYVTDQGTLETYEYKLPVTASSSPVATFGPTQQGLGSTGDPVSGGWNSGSTELAQGDCYGWVDLISSGNTVSTAITIDDLPCLLGAAYASSAQP